MTDFGRKNRGLLVNLESYLQESHVIGRKRFPGAMAIDARIGCLHCDLGGQPAVEVTHGELLNAHLAGATR